MSHPAATALPWSSVTAAARHRAGNDASPSRAPTPAGAAAFAAELNAAGLPGPAVAGTGAGAGAGAAADGATVPGAALKAAMQPASSALADDAAALAAPLEASVLQTAGSAQRHAGGGRAPIAGDPRAAAADKTGKTGKFGKTDPADQAQDKGLPRPGQWPRGVRQMDSAHAHSPAASRRDGMAMPPLAPDVADGTVAGGASADPAQTTTDAEAADPVATAAAMASGAGNELASWWAQSAAWARHEVTLAHHAVGAAAASDASSGSATPAGAGAGAGAAGHDPAVALVGPTAGGRPDAALRTAQDGKPGRAAEGRTALGRRAVQPGAEGSATAASPPRGFAGPLSKVSSTAASALPSGLPNALPSVLPSVLPSALRSAPPPSLSASLPALVSAPVSAKPVAQTENDRAGLAPVAGGLAGTGDAAVTAVTATKAPVRGTVAPSDAHRKDGPAVLAPPDPGPVTAPPAQVDGIPADPATGGAAPQAAWTPTGPTGPIRPAIADRAGGPGRNEPTGATGATESAANPASLATGAPSGPPAAPAAGTFVVPMPPAAEAVNAPLPGAEVRLPVPPGDPRFAPALAAQVTVFMRQGVHEARLQLHPAELGPITVQIQLDGSAAQVSMAAAHAQTRQALEQALPTLAATLREAGLTLTGGGVFEQPRPGQGDTPGNTAGGDGSRDRGGQAGGGRGDDRAGTEAAARAPRPLGVRGLVDLVA